MTILQTALCLVIIPGFSAPVSLVDRVHGDPAWERVSPESGWCGIKALWLATQGYGLKTDLTQLRHIALRNGASPDLGVVSLRCLELTACEVGIGAQAARCTEDALRAWNGFAITVHARSDQGGIHHALLVLGYEDATWRVVDPYDPSRVRSIPSRVFARTWTGDAVLLSRSPEAIQSMRFRLRLDRWLPICTGVLWAVILTLFVVSRARLRATIQILLLVVAAGCHGEDTRPQLKLEIPERSFFADRVYSADDVLEHDFLVTNDSNEAVHVTTVCGCSCTTVQNKEIELAPQQSAAVLLTAHLKGRDGRFVTEAELFISRVDGTGLCSQGTIQFGCEVRPRSQAVPPIVAFGEIVVGHTASQRVTVTVYNNTASQGILVAEATDPACIAIVMSESMRQLVASKQHVYEVDVKATPLYAGLPIQGTIRLRLDSAGEVMIPVSGLCVHPSWSVHPRSVVLFFGSADAPVSFGLEVAGIAHDECRYRFVDVSFEPTEAIQVVSVSPGTADQVTVTAVLLDSRPVQKCYLEIARSNIAGPPYLLPVICIDGAPLVERPNPNAGYEDQ